MIDDRRRQEAWTDQGKRPATATSKIINRHLSIKRDCLIGLTQGRHMGSGANSTRILERKTAQAHLRRTTLLVE